MTLPGFLSLVATLLVLFELNNIFSLTEANSA